MSDRRDHAPGDHGCAEYRTLKRRQFLQVGAHAAAAGLVLPLFPAWLPRVVLAESASTRDTIVSIFLRGGADGLTLCVPFGDPHYYTARPTLAIAMPDANAAQRVTALDDFFGFPPALTPLLPAFTSRDLLVVHAAGQLGESRSHFKAQRLMELARPDEAGAASGWLARHLASVPPLKAGAQLRGLALTDGMPYTLSGAPQSLAIANPGAIVFSNGDESRSFLRATCEAEPEPFRSTALDAIATATLLASLNIDRYVPADGVVYPDTPFGRALRSTAALIKADVGLEAAHVDLGDWDTHASQDPVAGAMFAMMKTLADGLAAFHADVMAPRTRPVTLVAMSEFGRHVAQNGSNGTDHGRGSAFFVMGGAIAGGRVLVNRWPGLAPEERDDEALRVTIDYRDILAEVVSRRLGNPDLSIVFPGLTPRTWGVIRA